MLYPMALLSTGPFREPPLCQYKKVAICDLLFYMFARPRSINSRRKHRAAMLPRRACWVSVRTLTLLAIPTNLIIIIIITVIDVKYAYHKKDNEV